MVTMEGKRLDFEAIKRAQQQTWASGDFAMVASRVLYVSEHLLEEADVQAGDHVLDVATGSGNAALAAARRNAAAVGVDYVPALLERGRLRAEAEQLTVDFLEGDAEALPVQDGFFDVVTSVFGVMFAPDHRRAASELLRVCRPGGKIALASWTPGGYIGEMFRLMSRYIAPTPGLEPPVRWGDPAHLRELFGSHAASMTSTARVCLFKWRSAEENVAFFRRYYGPTLKAFGRLGAGEQGSLERELAGLARRFDRNRGRGSISIEGEYLETLIIRA